MFPAATQAPLPMRSLRDVLGDNQHHLSAGQPKRKSWSTVVLVQDYTCSPHQIQIDIQKGSQSN